MPFDGKFADTDVLVTAVANLGKVPISQSFLASYKTAQLNKHASWLYRHRHHLPLWAFAALFVGLMVMVTGDSMSPAFKPVIAIGLGILAMAIVLMVTMTFGITVKAPHWVSYRTWPTALRWSNSGVPESIATLVCQVVDQVPGASIMIGELRQRTEVIDPYVTVHYRGENVCLGIWEGDRIVVACADAPRSF